MHNFLFSLVSYWFFKREIVDRIDLIQCYVWKTKIAKKKKIKLD